MLRLVIFIVLASDPHFEFFPGYNYMPCPNTKQDMIMALPNVKPSPSKDPIIFT